AVPVVVGGVIAEGVLAAELFGYLVEGFFELLLGVDIDHAPAGIIRQAAGDSAISSVTRISNEQDMNHRIGALRGLNRLLQLYLAAFVLGIGDDHDGFASRFTIQLFTAG